MPLHLPTPRHPSSHASRASWDASHESQPGLPPAPGEPIRVVLVDASLMLLELLALRINADAGMTVVGTATQGEEALRLVAIQRPHVVVLDVDLPGPSPFNIARAMVDQHKELKIIFLAGYLCDAFVGQALRVGAHGFLLKGESTNRLIDCIKRLRADEPCFSEQVARRLTFDSARRRYTLSKESGLISLTTRQMEVLRYLARGHTVKEIARTLDLSEKSVDSHKYRVMHKLGIHNRVELVRYAIREGLMLP